MSCLLTITILIFLAIFGIFCAFIFPAFSSVCSNCAGILYNSKSRKYEDLNKIYHEGYYYVDYYRSFKTIPLSKQIISYKNINARSKEGLKMPINVDIVYKYIEKWENIYNIHTKYDDYDKFLYNIASLKIYDSFCKYNASDLYKNRNKIVTSLKNSITDFLSNYYVQVTNVYLTGSDLPDEVSQAIQLSVNAEQRVKLAENEKEIVRVLYL